MSNYKLRTKKILEALGTKDKVQDSYLWRFFSILATVFVAVAFLIHIYLPPTEPEVVDLKNKVGLLDSKIQKNKDSIIVLSTSLLNAEIKEQFFNIQVEGLNKERKAYELELVSSLADLNTAKDVAKISGFSSRHKFLWNFGIGLVIISAMVDILLLCSNPLIFSKLILNLKGAVYGCIGGYYMAWIFYPENDLPKQVYLHLLLFIGLLSGTLAFYLVRTKRRNVQLLRNIIKAMGRFIMVDVPDKHIAKENLPHYDKEKINVLRKGVE